MAHGEITFFERSELVLAQIKQAVEAARQLEHNAAMLERETGQAADSTYDKRMDKELDAFADYNPIWNALDTLATDASIVQGDAQRFLALGESLLNKAQRLNDSMAVVYIMLDDADEKHGLQ